MAQLDLCHVKNIIKGLEQVFASRIRDFKDFIDLNA
jgi:hypothetical protein